VRKVVRMQTKGRITIPAELRRKLGLVQGDYLVVEEGPGTVLLTPEQIYPLHSEPAVGYPSITGFTFGSPDGTVHESPEVLEMRRLGESLRMRLRSLPPAVGDDY
jgi:AbrB family looped-hinge helix DNA binding protein